MLANIINALYQNIGQLLKRLAIGGFIIETLATVIGGFLMILYGIGEKESLFALLGFLALFLGWFVAFLLSLPLYATGLIVQSAEKNLGADVSQEPATHKSINITPPSARTFSIIGTITGIISAIASIPFLLIPSLLSILISGIVIQKKQHGHVKSISVIISVICAFVYWGITLLASRHSVASFLVITGQLFLVIILFLAWKWPKQESDVAEQATSIELRCPYCSTTSIYSEKQLSTKKPLCPSCQKHFAFEYKQYKKTLKKQ